MAPLKFGSSSKTSTFKRSAFPMQTGTASHTTAVKKASALKETKSDIDKLTEITIQNKIAEQEKIKKKREKEKAEQEKNLNIAKEAGFDTYEEYQKDQEKKEAQERESHKTQKTEGKLKKQKGKDKHSKLTEKSNEQKAIQKDLADKIKVLAETDTSGMTPEQLEAHNKKIEDLQGQVQKSTKKSKKLDKKLETAPKTTKKADRLKEKLAESKMYDDMSIEDRLAYKQKKKDQRNKDIRNTIATIDSIIPTAYGGGRGVSRVQEDDDGTKKISDKKNFSDTDKDYISEAGKGNDKEQGNIDTTKEETSIAEENKENIVTKKETDLKKQDEHKGTRDNTNTDSDVEIKTTRYKESEEESGGSDTTYTDLKSEKGDPYSYRKGSDNKYQYKLADDDDWTTAEGEGEKAIKARYEK